MFMGIPLDSLHMRAGMNHSTEIARVIGREREMPDVLNYGVVRLNSLAGIPEFSRMLHSSVNSGKSASERSNRSVPGTIAVQSEQPLVLDCGGVIQREVDGVDAVTQGGLVPGDASKPA